MRKFILPVLSFLTISVFANLTAQLPDKLIYKGDTISIFSSPLESYPQLNNINSLPEFKGCGSTACWRGYVAVWEMVNDSLFLNAITPCYKDCRNDSKSAKLKNIFGSKYINGRVYAHWVDEILLSPQGRLLKYVHMGYGSIYEKELHLTVKKGKLINENWISNSINDPELIDRFNYDLMQDTLFQNISKLNWDELGNELLCDDSYLITINKNGKPKSISYGYYKSKWEKFWWNLTDRKCRRKIFNSIKHLEFDLLLIHGKPQKEVVKIEIFWNDETQKLELWKN